MSQYIVKAHGGSKNIKTQKYESVNTGAIVSNTMANAPKNIHMKNLEGLILKTTGLVAEEPVMEGVLTKTTPKEKAVAEIHKIHDVGATKQKIGVGLPYTTKKSGYKAK